MDYRNYKMRSFDEDAPEEEAGQLEVRSAEDSFDTPRYEAGGGGQGFEEDIPHVQAASNATDFASIKFQRENTLLTNAERYADSIREEAELYVRQLQKEIEALNVQADQRYEEARNAKEDAEAGAERRIQEAGDRVEEIRAQGYKEGYESGREEGQRKRYEEAGAFLANIEEILGDLSQFQKQVRYFMEKDGVRLAVLMAKKILQQELKVNKNLIWKLLAKTLASMEGAGQFRIWLNPEDLKFATSARPTLEKYTNDDQSLSFRGRPEIPPGNAMIETDREVIDLTLASQFRHLDQMLYQSLAESEARALNLPPEVLASSQEAEISSAGDVPPDAPPTATAQPETAEEEAGQRTAIERVAQALPRVEGDTNVTVSEIMPEGEMAEPSVEAAENQEDGEEGITGAAPQDVPHE